MAEEEAEVLSEGGGQSEEVEYQVIELEGTEYLVDTEECLVFHQHQQSLASAAESNDSDVDDNMQLVGRWDAQLQQVIFLEDDIDHGADELNGAEAPTPSEDARGLLTAEALSAFQEDGICILDDVVPAAVVQQ
eukprot:gene19528-23354_t